MVPVGHAVTSSVSRACARREDRHVSDIHVSDLEIARSAKLLPTEAIAKLMDLRGDVIKPHGQDVAKIDLSALDDVAQRPQGRYVVVTAMTPPLSARARPPRSSGRHRPWGVEASVRWQRCGSFSMGPTLGIKGGAAGEATARSCPWSGSTCTSLATSTR